MMEFMSYACVAHKSPYIYSPCLVDLCEKKQVHSIISLLPYHIYNRGRKLLQFYCKLKMFCPAKGKYNDTAYS